ncbi:fused MFS/spermidine synthase [Methylobacterium sp. Leaf108]|uniref:fused MFS/spermidine synthase n=1 Tax=Methylobacterium sp. Leaf108 TaxID=1736256 RepID=UPI001FCDA5E4|nr:fused MFS/spermidine synthase [Methylobacterium sp. Leaf108]
MWIVLRPSKSYAVIVDRHLRGGPDTAEGGWPSQGCQRRPARRRAKERAPDRDPRPDADRSGSRDACLPTSARVASATPRFNGGSVIEGGRTERIWPMTTLTVKAGPVRSGPSARLAAFLGLYTATIFLSALLLFGIQPMFTKMVLPVLGGSPSVWSVAMVVFQALLLLGYAYAHALVRYCPLRIAAAVHVLVMVGAFAALPIQLAAGWGKPPADGEAVWLLGLFLASVGLPFFALSANGPLLQAWFARSGHPQAEDPYFLYGASNIGSFLALIAYPLAVEPFVSLQDQSRAWTFGFAGLAAVIALCATTATRMAAGTDRSARIPLLATTPANAGALWRERLAWVALAFVPSGLLVAVTAHISTDVAAAPLLWVVPLALFLLTFVLAFRDRMAPSQLVLSGLQVIGTALALFPMISATSLFVGLALHLGLFFVNAMICHGALYQGRPAAGRLTEFYLCLSFGGMLGGIFCALVAPRLFSTVLEYPILLVVALACRPDLAALSRTSLRDGWRRIVLAATLLAAGSAVTVSMLPASALVFGLLALIALMIAQWRKPLVVALAGLTLAVSTAHLQRSASETTAFRSFFGIHKLSMSSDGRFRMLNHGTTLHGAMRVTSDDGTPFLGRPEPVTYYGMDGAMGTAIAASRASHGGTLGAVTVVGLGAGSLACHAVPGEAWTFLEIDPEVVRIASDPTLFRFLGSCAPQARIVVGDARLTLAEQTGANALIVVDAFSSDAIPSHLLTREALGLYVSKLERDGVIVIHISNHHLELRHILARAAADSGLVTYVRDDSRRTFSQSTFIAPSVVVAMARTDGDLEALHRRGDWTKVIPDNRRTPWSDDFSNIVEAMVDKVRR